MTNRTVDFQLEQVETYLERATDIRHAPTPTANVKARMVQAADSLSRAGTMRAQLDVAAEAMAALVSILYHADDDGQPCNFDKATGRILIPLPWGAAGWRAWGVRKWEAAILRTILMERSTQRRRRPPLFDYNAEARTWHLSYADYPATDTALSWIRRDGPSLAEWRTAVLTYREYMADKMRERRG